MASFWKFFGSRKTSDGRYIRWPRGLFSFFGTVQIDEDSAMQVAAFNRGVVYISTQVAKLPWDVKNGDSSIVPKAPVGNLLNISANPEMNAFRFRIVMIQQAIIHGNAYAEIERDITGRPIALWPLYSAGMQLIRLDDGSLAYRYNYHPNGQSEQIILAPRDVFHIPNFHTKDGLVGQGVVAYGREVLGINISTDRMAGGLFRNGGVPSGVLQSTGALSDEAYERLKKSWAEQHGGGKQGGTAILEEGVTYQSINMQPDVLQFLQSRQFGVLEIARFLGLPPTKLYDVVAAKYSNVENSNLEVATDTLHAWAKSFEIEGDVKLLNERYGGRYTEIDLYEIFRGDMVTRANYFKTMISIGSMTPNEIRAREGMAPYADGKNFYIATNNLTPVDRLDEVIDADIEQKTKPAPAPQLPGKGSPDENSDPENEDGKKQDANLKDAAIKFLTSAAK